MSEKSNENILASSGRAPLISVLDIAYDLTKNEITNFIAFTAVGTIMAASALLVSYPSAEGFNALVPMANYIRPFATGNSFSTALVDAMPIFGKEAFKLCASLCAGVLFACATNSVERGMGLLIKKCFPASNIPN